MLSQGDLERMRATAELALPGTAVVQTSAFVSDSGGGGTFGWTNQGTFPCRLSPLGGDERMVGGRISPDADSVITLPDEVSITESARILTAGGTYNVEAIRDQSWDLTTRVEVSRET